MSADLAALQQAGNLYGQQVDTAKGNLVDTLGSALFESANIANNTVSTGSSMKDGRTVYTTPLQVASENIAALEAQSRNQSIAKSLGISPDATADLQNQLATMFMEATKASMAQTQHVNELKSVGLFDDPLQFLVNQVLLPDEINKLNAHQSTAADALGKIQGINQAVQQTSVTSNLIQSHITDATLDDQLAAAQAELDNKRSGLRYKNNMDAAHLIKEIAAMDAAKFSLYSHLYQYEASADAELARKEARAAASALESVAQQKYNDEKKALAHRLALINEAEIWKYGQAKTSEEDLRVKPNVDKQFYAYAARMADLGANLKHGMPVVAGENITERVASFQSDAPKYNTTAVGEKLIALQNKVYADVRAENKGAKPEEINQKAEERFKVHMDNMRLNVDPADQTNPYSLEGLAAYDMMRSVSENPAYKYFRTIEQDKTKPFDSDKFLHTVLPAIQKGQISYKDAARALYNIGKISAEASDAYHDIYYLTGYKNQGIQVPVRFYSSSQQVAKAAALYGTGLSAAAAASGIGVMPALGLGGITAGAAMYGAKPQTTLLPLNDLTKIEQTIIAMIPSTINLGVGADALKPALQKQGVE